VVENMVPEEGAANHMKGDGQAIPRTCTEQLGEQIPPLNRQPPSPRKRQSKIFAIRLTVS
jgi:hypothetical protein